MGHSEKGRKSMGFNIPMNTQGPMSADSLLSLNSGSGMGNLQSALETQLQMQQSVLQAQPHVQQSVRQRPQGGGVHLKKGQRVSLGENT